jgi:hypothetical protein
LAIEASLKPSRCSGGFPVFGFVHDISNLGQKTRHDGANVVVVVYHQNSLGSPVI